MESRTRSFANWQRREWSANSAHLRKPVTQTTFRIFMKTHACFHALAIGLLLGLGSAICNAQTLDVPWALSYGITGPTGGTTDSIIVDPQGDTFLARLYTFSPLEMGPLGLDAPPNLRAAYIAEVDPDGQPLWLKSIDPAQNRPGIFSLARDASGNLWAVGSFASFNGPVAFGSTELTNGPGLVLKLDPDGNVLWAKSINSTNSCVALAVAIDSAGNLVVAGTFNQSVSIDGTTVSTQWTGQLWFRGKTRSDRTIALASRHRWATMAQPASTRPRR